MTKAIWTPRDEDVAAATVSAFIRYVNANAYAGTQRPLYPHGGIVGDWHGLYQWSIDYPEEFWAAVWRFCGVLAQEGPEADPWDEVLVGGELMQPPGPDGPRWFTGAR